MLVVFHGVFGLRVDVGVVEGAAQFGGYWLRVGFELADEIPLVDDVDPDQQAQATEDPGMVLGRREGRVGSWGEGGKYKLEARTMDNGYAWKSLMVDTRREAFLLPGSLGKRMVFIGEGRLIGSRELLWKAD